MPLDSLATPLVDRRQRQKAHTRRRLLDAARELFVADGYDATRPQDIARRADVAAGTFYAHFDDKRDVFLAFTAEVTEELLERVRARAAGARRFDEALQRSLEALFAYADANPGVLRAVSADAAVGAANLPPGASLRERLAERLAAQIREARVRGEVPADYDPLVVAHGVVGFVHHALVYGASAGRDAALLLANLKSFCQRALLAPARPEETAS